MGSTPIKFLAGILFTLLVSRYCLANSFEEEKKRIKKRVAVFTFEDKTGKQLYWWNRKSIGEGISDMVTTELIKTGNYRVIEGPGLERLLQEHGLRAFGALTPGGAAELGKVLGLELVVVGAVMEFGYRRSNAGGRIRGFGPSIQNQSATVELNYQILNAHTGVIVSAETVRKEKSSKAVRRASRNLQFQSQKAFDVSPVGKAVRDAVREVTQLIDENAPEVAWQARVVQEKEGVVVMDAGSKSGIRAGDTFVIYRKGEELIDPDTGLSLGSMETKIGEIEVTDPDLEGGRAALCRIVKGADFQAGDFVRFE